MRQPRRHSWSRPRPSTVAALAAIGLAACATATPEAIETSILPAAVLREVGLIAWSADGKTFAVASSPGNSPQIQLYVYKDGALEMARTLPSEQGVLALAFSPDGKVLATGGDDGVVRLWSVSSGELERSLSGHTGGVYGLAYRPDGQMLASRDGTSLRLWQPATGDLMQAEDLGGLDPYAGLSFSPDSRWLGVIYYSDDFPDGKLELRAVDGGDSPTISHVEENAFLFSVAFSPQGEILATLGSDRNAGGYFVRLWRFQEDGLVLDKQLGPFGADSVSFSPDGRTLAIGNPDAGVQLWDIRTGKLLQTVPDWYVVAGQPVSFSPDGRWLARPGGFVPFVTLYQVGPQPPARDLSLQSPQLVGNDVFELQGRLAALGYLPGGYVPGGEANGIFDQLTETAVRSFQTDSGLPSTGIVDTATATRLAEAYTAVVGPAPATAAVALQPSPPQPETPAATPTKAPQPTVAPPAVRTFLPSEQDVADIASIWDWYQLSDGLDLQVPGAREFTVNVTPDKTFIWPFFWCASDESNLLDNLASISVDFRIDLADVSPDDILQFEREIPGWTCHYWATGLTKWRNGAETNLAVLYTFTRDTNDGTRIYPAGAYAYILRIKVGD